MKFTVIAGELSAALTGPCSRARTHATIAILKHIKIDAKDGLLRILGHDLDSSNESTVESDVIEDGACCIPSEPLSRLLAGIPKSATVIFERDGHTTIIKSGRSRYKLPCLEAADMPLPLSADGGVKITISETELEQLFVRPRNAINLKDNRQICHGVFLHPNEGKLSAVATTGFFLLRFSTEIVSDDFKGAIIPRSATDEMLKIGAGEVTISDRIVSISSGGRTYSSKIIDAKFPEHYRKIIPDADGKFITVDRDALLECLSRLRCVGDFIESDLIDISIAQDEISISVTGAADGAEVMECEASESKFICLKISQLHDSLKVMRGETLRLYVGTETQPVRIVDVSEPTAVNVLMPCGSKTHKRVAA